MRGTPGARLALAVLAPLFLLLWLIAVRSEEARPWMRWQVEFNRLRAERARTALAEARGRGDAAAVARWQRVAEEAAQAEPEVRQLWLDDLRVADRCPTCHVGIDDPSFADAPEPLRAHPGTLLAKHDPARFGCTLCHGGDGRATTIEAAHARGPDAGSPLLPKAYLQSACLACHEVPHGLAGAEVATRGSDLFLERGCYGCHTMPGMANLPKLAPPLAGLDTKLVDARRWIPAWLRDPASLSRHTLMPRFTPTDEEAAKITAFLLSLPGEKPPPPVDLGSASSESGERIFKARGCRGCHGIDPDEAGAAPRVPSLARIGSTVRPAWLDRWLADPRAVNPESPMPKIKLADEGGKEDQARHDLVAYLATRRGPELPAPAVDSAAADRAEGRRLVEQYECAGCHTIPGFEKARPAVPDLGEFARRPVDELDFGTTDLPRTKWDWLARKLREPRAFASEKIQLRMPVTPLADDEVAALVTFVLGSGARTLPERYRAPVPPAARGRRNVAWLVSRFHCDGCHRLGGREPRIASFLERKHLVPPVLEGVGARLQGQYFYDFLLEPLRVRPWLELRMPTFGFTEAEARALVDAFSAAGGATNPHTHIVRDRLPPERFARGLRRFRHFKCGQCHPTSIDQGLPPDLDPEDLSINLMLVKSRLRPEWVKEFLARPKEIAGIQTRMPTVFYTVDGQPKIERPEEDIEDITTYMMGMTEPPEVTAAAEAEAKKAEAPPIDWSTYKY